MEVVYDEFRTDDTVVENANTTGSAQVIKQNTRATVEDDDAFVRLGLENPNSYAVAFEVQLSEEIVRPATLGTVRATDTDGVTADWQAQHDFEAEETHTRVTVVVPAETDVLFTPSQLRVKSPLVDRRSRTVGRDAPRARHDALGGRPPRTAHVPGHRQRR